MMGDAKVNSSKCSCIGSSTETNRSKIRYKLPFVDNLGFVDTLMNKYILYILNKGTNKHSSRLLMLISFLTGS